MKKLKKLLTTIITIILSLILLFNLYNFISLKIFKKALPTINGYAILEVATGSMRPTLKEGDLIIINTKEKNYKVNDIITFYDINGSFVTHRLVSLNQENIITKGDANNTEDEPLPKENIVGKYLFKLSGVGIILASLRNPLVSIMILIIGILICYLISTNRFGEPLEEKEEFIASKEEPKLSKVKELILKIKKLNPRKIKKERRKIKRSR